MTRQDYIDKIMENLTIIGTAYMPNSSLFKIARKSLKEMSLSELASWYVITLTINTEKKS